MDEQAAKNKVLAEALGLKPFWFEAAQEWWYSPKANIACRIPDFYGSEDATGKVIPATYTVVTSASEGGYSALIYAETSGDTYMGRGATRAWARAEAVRIWAQQNGARHD